MANPTYLANRLHRAFIVKLNVGRVHTDVPFWTQRVRLWLWSRVIVLGLHLGFRVCVVGMAGSGKSLLLNAVTPGKVIDKEWDIFKGPPDYPRRWRQGDPLPAFSVHAVPEGFFSIDEPGMADQHSYQSLIDTLADGRRPYIVATQDVDRLSSLTLGQRWRRVLLVRLS